MRLSELIQLMAPHARPKQVLQPRRRRALPKAERITIDKVKPAKGCIALCGNGEVAFVQVRVTGQKAGTKRSRGVKPHADQRRHDRLTVLKRKAVVR